MTIERAAEILDPESKEKFYGESGKQEVFEAMRLAKLALEKRIKKTVHPFWTGNSAACPYCASAQYLYNEDGRRKMACTDWNIHLHGWCATCATRRGAG